MLMAQSAKTPTRKKRNLPGTVFKGDLGYAHFFNLHVHSVFSLGQHDADGHKSEDVALRELQTSKNTFSKSHYAGEAELQALPGTLWTAAEKETFFNCLARYSIHRVEHFLPHLPQKSTLQIMAYHQLLKSQLKQLKKRYRLRAGKRAFALEYFPHGVSYSSLPIAREVDEEWEDYEEAVSMYLGDHTQKYARNKAVRTRKYFLDLEGDKNTLFNFPRASNLTRVYNANTLFPSMERKMAPRVQYQSLVFLEELVRLKTRELIAETLIGRGLTGLPKQTGQVSCENSGELVEEPEEQTGGDGEVPEESGEVKVEESESESENGADGESTKNGGVNDAEVKCEEREEISGGDGNGEDGNGEDGDGEEGNGEDGDGYDGNGETRNGETQNGGNQNGETQNGETQNGGGQSGSRQKKKKGRKKKFPLDVHRSEIWKASERLQMYQTLAGIGSRYREGKTALLATYWQHILKSLRPLTYTEVTLFPPPQNLLAVYEEQIEDYDPQDEFANEVVSEREDYPDEMIEEFYGDTALEEEEGAPDSSEDSVGKETTSAEKEAPSAEKETTNAEKEASSTEKEAPSAEKETMSAEKETMSAETEDPSSEKETMSTKKVTASAEEESLILRGALEKGTLATTSKRTFQDLKVEDALLRAEEEYLEEIDAIESARHVRALKEKLGLPVFGTFEESVPKRTKLDLAWDKSYAQY